MTTTDQLAAIQARANDPFRTAKDGIGQVDADRDYLLALVREQAAKLEAVRALAATWHQRYEQAPMGNDAIESAIDDEAYKLEDIINGTDFAALTATDGAQ